MNNGLNLHSLKIQNFATFTNQQINFHNNFNSIVGETGSGKSLILDALQLALGARADKRFVRKEAEFATIEASFSVNNDDIAEYFDKLGFPYEDEIVIKRIIYSNGKSKSFLNYQNCHVNTLTQVARKYIDLVGQFENQKLLSEDYQLKLLDHYAGLTDKFIEYQNSYENLKDLENEYSRLNEVKQRSNERKEFLKFQINELEELNPSSTEENELKKKKDFIQNQENYQKHIGEINYLLSESEGSVLNQINQINRVLSAIDLGDQIDTRFSNIKAELEDISYELSKQADFDLDNDSIEEIIERLDSYQKAKRKFQCDTDQLSEILNKYKAEFEQITDIDIHISKILKEIDRISSICFNQAKELHNAREEQSKNLSKKITTLVNSLNMKGAIIKMDVSLLENLTKTGLTKLDFKAQTNPGEGFHAIKDIASGGELSRILLSLRQVLSTTGSISVFLFDEIDTGVGGETAQKIGKALREVSSNSQVIAITHLPQIANYADQLLIVEKEVVEEDQQLRTYSKVIKLGHTEIPEYIKEMQAL